MMTEEEAKEFFTLPLPERFHKYVVLELADEDGYREIMRVNRNNYLPMLQQIKEKMPAEFYMYFHDLLVEEEKEFFYGKFLDALQGRL